MNIFVIVLKTLMGFELCTRSKHESTTVTTFYRLKKINIYHETHNFKYCTQISDFLENKTKINIYNQTKLIDIINIHINNCMKLSVYSYIT